MGVGSTSYISTLLIKIMQSARVLMTHADATPINQDMDGRYRKGKARGEQRPAAMQTSAVTLATLHTQET